MDKNEAIPVAAVLAVLSAVVLLVFDPIFIGDWPTLQRLGLALMLGIFLTMLLDFIGELGHAIR